MTPFTAWLGFSLCALGRNAQLYLSFLKHKRAASKMSLKLLQKVETLSVIQWRSKDIFNSMYSGKKEKLAKRPQLLYYPVHSVYSKAFLTLKEKEVYERELQGVKLIFCPQQKKKNSWGISRSIALSAWINCRWGGEEAEAILPRRKQSHGTNWWPWLETR